MHRSENPQICDRKDSEGEWMSLNRNVHEVAYVQKQRASKSRWVGEKQSFKEIEMCKGRAPYSFPWQLSQEFQRKFVLWDFTQPQFARGPLKVNELKLPPGWWSYIRAKTFKVVAALCELERFSATSVSCCPLDAFQLSWLRPKATQSPEFASRVLPMVSRAIGLHRFRCYTRNIPGPLELWELPLRSW